MEKIISELQRLITILTALAQRLSPERVVSLRINEKTPASGGTNDYVKTKPVPAGKVWHIRTHAFENATGARGTLRAYIEREGGESEELYLWEQLSPGSAILYWWKEPVDLYPGERLSVRQASCTAGDALRLYGIGEEREE